MHDFDFDSDYHPPALDPPIEKILSLAFKPYDHEETELQTYDMNSKMQIEQPQQQKPELKSQPLMKYVAQRPFLEIEVAQDLKIGSAGAERCKDYPKYMANRIIDMLYAKTDVEDKLQRRKAVSSFPAEEKKALNQAEMALCCAFLQENKKSHNFLNILTLFGANSHLHLQNKFSDLFRLQSYKYFASTRSAVDYANGEMLFSNKLAVIKKLQKICDMCVSPFQVRSLSE